MDPERAPPLPTGMTPESMWECILRLQAEIASLKARLAEPTPRSRAASPSSSECSNPKPRRRKNKKRKTTSSPELPSDIDSTPPPSVQPTTSDVNPEKPGNMFSDSSSQSYSDSDSDMSIASAAKEKCPPPILLGKSNNWPKIRRALAAHEIPIRRAVNTSSGVRIYPQTVDSFRQITRDLDAKELEYSTHQLHQDRELVVVFRGVNEDLTEQEILDELKMKIPAVRRVHRMSKAGKIWPLITVHLDASSDEARTVFDIQTIGGLSVKAEAKRKTNEIPQCRRCLKFFHTANYCRAPFVCAFCGKNHATPACTVKDKKDAVPSCANCNGPHRATYRGCPKTPKKQAPNPSPAVKPVQPTTKHAPKRQQQTSTNITRKNATRPKLTYAQTTAPAAATIPPTPCPQTTPPLATSLPADALHATILAAVSKFAETLTAAILQSRS